MNYKSEITKLINQIEDENVLKYILIMLNDAPFLPYRSTLSGGINLRSMISVSHFFSSLPQC